MSEQLTPEELRIEFAKCLDEANQRLTVRLRDYARDYARDNPKSPSADLLCKTLDNIIATFPNKKPPEGGESKGAHPMKDTNPAVVACEIKISVTGTSFEEIRRLIDQIRDACKTNDYKLEVNFSGEFFNIPCN